MIHVRICVILDERLTSAVAVFVKMVLWMLSLLASPGSSVDSCTLWMKLLTLVVLSAKKQTIDEQILPISRPTIIFQIGKMAKVKRIPIDDKILISKYYFSIFLQWTVFQIWLHKYPEIPILDFCVSPNSMRLLTSIEICYILLPSSLF